MNLVIDIGNTRVKYHVFDRTREVQSTSSEHLDINQVKNLTETYTIDKSIVSDVRGCEDALYANLSDLLPELVRFTHQTPMPIANRYLSPETLGLDRIAAALGAYDQYPDDDILIFDFGTALTIDFLDSNSNYWGGNISPGLISRYRALNEFTGKLPLLEPNMNITMLGKTTQQAINNGVINGMVFEVKGYISYYATTGKSLKVIGTGGDIKIFDNLLKNTIFVVDNLVARGLNSILNYNA